jgi:hypothetical protein
MFDPGNFVGRAETASAAVKGLQRAASWINDLGVSARVYQLVKADDQSISDLISATGQTGVLYRVDIQKVDGETVVYSLVNNSIHPVGAGSSPLGVNIAVNQQDQLKPAPSSGATMDDDKSYFIWFTKEGGQIVARDIPAKNLISLTAFNLADQKLLETQKLANSALAMGATVKHLEVTIKDKALQKKLADWKSRQDETNRQAIEIGKQLESELEKARKAQRTAALFSLISGGMTLASQAVTLKNSLGSDAPKTIDGAKSSAELQKIANEVEATHTNNAETLRTKYQGFVDQGNGERVEFLQILRETKYPVGQVPELNLQ